MKIKISKASEKEIAKFNKKMWRGEDIEHYGQPVKWVKKDLIFKAAEQGRVVGTVKARYEVGVVYVRNLIVAKEKRGEGIGRRLMERVEKAGKKLGAHKMFLFTMEKWKACRFYRKLGYKKTGDLPKHFLKRNFVIYSKFI
jgi:ribosomal protein S18 acetylase RimI-like enzyme